MPQSAKSKRLKDKKCYASNSEKISATHKTYYQNNADKIKQASRQT